jgi:hypothetical protein
VMVGAIVVVTMMAASAFACGENMTGKATLKRQAWQASEFGSPALRLISDQDVDPIVGMWETSWTVGTTQIDNGFSVWHADGTEINNSGGRAPLTGNICLGVWKNFGNNRYKLNHVGISWDPTGTVEIGPANIVEEIVLGTKRNSFSGTFTITQYDMNGNVLAVVAGNITGTRINVDTVINSL